METFPYQNTDIALHHLPVGIALLDAQDFHLLTANQHYQGFLDPAWQEGQALGKPIYEWLPDAEEAGVMTILRTVKETGIAYQDKAYLFPAFARGITYWNWTLEPLRGPGGGIDYLLCTANDITAATQAHQRAKQERQPLRQECGFFGNKEQNHFLSLVSHELRTPMTVILGYIELLEMLIVQGNQLDINRLHQIFTRLHQQSGYLAQLIEELLEVTHLATGQVQMQTTICDLCTILLHAIEQTNGAEQRQITFSALALPQGTPVLVCCDARRMTHVFTHLLSNALKYSPANSAIDIHLSLSPGQPREIICQIRDQGTGITREELSLIFTRFYRATNVRALTSGLGIGLYLVKEIIEAHGGRIWVESEPGQGSIFFVAFPLFSGQEIGEQESA